MYVTRYFSDRVPPVSTTCTHGKDKRTKTATLRGRGVLHVALFGGDARNLLLEYATLRLQRGDIQGKSSNVNTCQVLSA